MNPNARKHEACNNRAGVRAANAEIVFLFGWCGSHFVLVWGLVEEEVGGQLFVLVAGEVGLDDEVTFEAEAAEALDCFALLLCYANGLGSGWQRRVLVGVFAQ